MRHRFRRAAYEADEQGGFSQALSRHTLVFFKRSDTLVVTFDNMKSREMPAPAYPWGYGLVAQQGHSHLGVMMSRRNDWFRQPDLDAWFLDAKAAGFFDGFRRVIFYGSSMGGYAGLCFAPVAPGCQVVAFGPQSSINPDVVPFENRYRPGFRRGTWVGSDFEDAAIGSRSAGQVVVFADPWHDRDAAHVRRLCPDNLVWAKTPTVGHDTARVMKVMGILKDSVLQAWDGTLTEDGFRDTWRAARGSQKLARAVVQRALDAGHPRLAKRALRDLKVSHPDWRFPGLRAQTKAALRARDMTQASDG